MTVHRYLILASLLLLLAPAAHAQSMHWIDSDSVIVCPASPGQTQPPDFSKNDCRNVNFWEVETQGRSLWMKGVITVSENTMTSENPLGLYISGKASSEAYLNGRLVGRNGKPGQDSDSETPGLMDAVLYLPREFLIAGENEIVLHMSGQRGFLQLRNPLHRVGVSDYANPADMTLRRYWPSLITFGAFVLGALYFGVSALRGGDRFGSSLLALISLFAAGQLFTEASRGLFAYPYPVHDLRLLLIVLFSLGFGLCLSAHVVSKLFPIQRLPIISAIAVLTIIVIFGTPSFDGKANIAVFMPTLASAACAGFGVWRKRPRALFYLSALLLFAGVILASPSNFLDIIFFYAVAGLLVFLFVQQADVLAQEQKLRQSEAARAQQLQQALDQVREKEKPPQIKIKHVGKVEMVAADRITHCNAAGDYVELCFSDGAQTLHSGSLNELEESLPSTFLRVHRSHLVNTAFVRSLKRESSGVGQLAMSTGAAVPVSRRIMPKVRSALS